MAKNQEMYALLTRRKYDEVGEALEAEGNQNFGMLALLSALRGEKDAAKDYLGRIQPGEGDAGDQALATEAELVLGANERKTFDELAAIARTAIDLDPNSMFAHYTLGQIAERKRRNAEALEEYEVVLEHNPENNSIILACARLLFLKHRSSEALGLLKKAQLSNRRSAYEVLGRLFYTPWKFLIIAAAAIVMLIPETALFTFAVITVVCVIGSYYAVKLRDPFIFSTFGSVLFVTGLMFLARSVLGMALKF
jgi:tetratricopeptide (TPR) repeat protein